jgi:hypothetical protein
VYGSSDTGSYTFSEQTTGVGEVGGLILAYRGVNGSAVASLSAWGFGSSADGPTVTVGQISVPANNELVAVFKDGADDNCTLAGCSEIAGTGDVYSQVSGPPVPLTSVTPTSFIGSAWVGFAADIWNGNTRDFGPYSSGTTYLNSKVSTLPLGWEVLAPVGGLN